MTKKTSEKIEVGALLGADQGNGFFKTTRDGKTVLVTPSILADVAPGERMGADHLENPAIFCLDGQWRVSGYEARVLGVNPSSFRNMNRYTDDFYRHLMGAALARAFFDCAAETPEPLNIRIAANIPVQEYKAGRIAQVKARLAGTYKIEFLNGKKLIINIANSPENPHISVITEGAGAFFLARASMRFGLSTVAVIDVGDYTTNINIFGKETPDATVVKWIGGDSSKNGMSQVVEKILIHLRSEYSFEGDEADINWALTKGHDTIDLGGERCLQFSSVLDSAALGLFQSILRFYNTARKTYSPAYIIFAGGGSEILRKYLALEMQAKGWTCLPEGQTANVRGLFMALSKGMSTDTSKD